MHTHARTSQRQQQHKADRRTWLEPNRYAFSSRMPDSIGTYTALLSMHRTVGNQAISQVIQAKLRENQSGKTSPQGTEHGITEGSLTPSSAGQPLPEAVRQKMETAFGQDFSQVRIHEGPQAPSIGAVAYTRGTDIHFASGTYQPESSTGQALLGHELTHVVQQRVRHVHPVQSNGIPVNDEPALENEANTAGTQAARGDRVNVGKTNIDSQHAQSVAPIQMVRVEDLIKKFEGTTPSRGSQAQQRQLESGVNVKELIGKFEQRPQEEQEARPGRGSQAQQRQFSQPSPLPEAEQALANAVVTSETLPVNPAEGQPSFEMENPRGSSTGEERTYLHAGQFFPEEAERRGSSRTSTQESSSSLRSSGEESPYIPAPNFKPSPPQEPSFGKKIRQAVGQPLKQLKGALKRRQEEKRSKRFQKELTKGILAQQYKPSEEPPIPLESLPSEQRQAWETFLRLDKEVFDANRQYFSNKGMAFGRYPETRANLEKLQRIRVEWEKASQKLNEFD